MNQPLAKQIAVKTDSKPFYMVPEYRFDIFIVKQTNNNRFNGIDGTDNNDVFDGAEPNFLILDDFDAYFPSLNLLRENRQDFLSRVEAIRSRRESKIEARRSKIEAKLARIEAKLARKNLNK